MESVIFYHEKDGNDVFAYFPHIKGDLKGNNTCYAHIGQHSACSPDYVKECKEANYSAYSDLLKELISIGYKDLVICNKQIVELHRKPTAGEIKFGEGATHYKSFEIDAIINRKGNLKKWMFCPTDGLRYYK